MIIIILTRARRMMTKHLNLQLHSIRNVSHISAVAMFRCQGGYLRQSIFYSLVIRYCGTVVILTCSLQKALRTIPIMTAMTEILLKSMHLLKVLACFRKTLYYLWRTNVTSPGTMLFFCFSC